MDLSFNPFTLEGKTILVTGATSGIGRAIATMCARMGATIVAMGRNGDRLRQTYSELYGVGHKAFRCDLTDEEQTTNVVKSLPTLNGVVHAAGIGHRKPCKLVTRDDIDMVMRTNFQSVVMLQTALLQNKKIAKDSSIVLVSSRAAQAPSVGNALYSASKGALLSYAKCLALELAVRGIRVNSICPGMVWTKLITADGISREQLEEAEKEYPLKRFGVPDDIAYLAIYLLSDASKWMTGVQIDISGGGEGILKL